MGCCTCHADQQRTTVMPAGAGRVAGSWTFAKAASVADDCAAKLKGADAGSAGGGGGADVVLPAASQSS